MSRGPTPGQRNEGRADPREERVRVACEYRLVAECRASYEVSRRAEAKNRSRNDGRFICLYCSRRGKFSGRSNPNVRYPALDDGFFEQIDSEGKAYLLGWIASDGSIAKGSISIFVHPKDAAIVDQWRSILATPLPSPTRRDRVVGLQLSSQRMVADVCRWLDIPPGKKSNTVGFPRLASERLQWAFVRGFFDGDGSIMRPRQDRGPRCSITTNSERMRRGIAEFCGIRASHSADHLEWSGNNALDFLGHLYENATYSLPRKRDLYHDWCVWVPSLTSHGRDALFRWVKADPAAVPPAKARVTDSGYDLTILRRIKQHGAVEFFDTGIKVQPAFGWYFDVVARSSLSKTGYLLANAVGVIDRTYTGTIVVPLIKVDPSAPDLELPARVAQMIPRPIVHVQLHEVESLDDTARGAGGFGSTGTGSPGR